MSDRTVERLRELLRLRRQGGVSAKAFCEDFEEEFNFESGLNRKSAEGLVFSEVFEVVVRFSEFEKDLKMYPRHFLGEEQVEAAVSRACGELSHFVDAPLTEIKGSQLVQSAWKKVFATEDPFVWPFQDAIAGGRVFFPTDEYHLTEEQYTAVLASAREVGEVDFFLSITEGLSFEPSNTLQFLDGGSGHWSCSSPSYDKYLAVPLPLQSALYSKDGGWGVLVSHESHALVGGNFAFVRELSRRYPDWAADLGSLRAAWSENENAEWLEPTIARIMPSIGSNK